MRLASRIWLGIASPTTGPYLWGVRAFFDGFGGGFWYARDGAGGAIAWLP